MKVAVIFFLVVVGSLVFHILTPWWWTPVASNWGNIDDTIIGTDDWPIDPNFPC